MSVSYSHDISGYEVGSAGSKVVVFGESESCFVGVVAFEVDESCPLIEGLTDALPVILVDFGVVFCLNDLNEPNFVASGKSTIDIHFEIESILSPQFVKHSEHLKYKVVLFEVIPVFEHDFIGIVFVVFIGNAGKSKRQLFRIIHFAFLLPESFEGVLWSDGEEKPFLANLVEFVLH
jgi:hypothetical protein